MSKDDTPVPDGQQSVGEAIPRAEDPTPATQSDGAGNGGKSNDHDVAPDAEEPVGYGRPPVHSRFKPGQSGNPKGRRRTAKGIKTIFREELLRPIRLKVNGKPTTLTKFEILLKKLAEKGADGDVKSISKLIDIGIAVLGLEEEEDRSASLTAEEEAIIENLKRRLARRDEGGDLPQGNSNVLSGQSDDRPKGDTDTGKEEGKEDD